MDQTKTIMQCGKSPALMATRNNATSVPTLRVIGLMSGTSLDGCDAVLTEISPRGGSVHIETLAFITYPMPTTLRERIVTCLKPESHMDELARLDALLSHWFIDAIDALLATTEYTREDIDLIGSHGQTMWHDVNLHLQYPEKVKERMTWQLGDGSFIAAITGITTVCDFRTADVAVGGQGAPLIPFFDHLLYACQPSLSLSLSPFSHNTSLHHSKNDSETTTTSSRVSLNILALQNIGGIGNVTMLPTLSSSSPTSPTLAMPVLGFDTGPGNMIIDRFVELATKGQSFYDCNGELASKGQVHDALLQQWMTKTQGSEFFQQSPPKSTGREQFGHDYADLRYEEAMKLSLSSEDAIATATALTARSIVLSYEQGFEVIVKKIQSQTQDGECEKVVMIDELKVIVAGGGAHNKTLLKMVQELLHESSVFKHVNKIQVLCAGEKGGENDSLPMVAISADAKEAIAFAVLAYQAVCGRRNHLRSTTGGAKERILGKICPGDNFYQVLLTAQERHYQSKPRPSNVAVTASASSNSSAPLPVTETRLFVSEQIDRLSASEIVDVINCEDTHVSRVVASLRESIAKIAEMIADSIVGSSTDDDEEGAIKGRVFYFGAGTSGRLGVLDASEIPPTFSAPREWFQGIIAGGDQALRTAVEGAEDSVIQGEQDVLARGIGPRDIVIGIASSGTTPYVHGVLRAAKEKANVRQTVLITCNPVPADAMTSSSTTPIGAWSYIDTVIAAVVGPEVLTGSTRMKAGTATKMILNQLSTVAMILAGKTLGNLMVDLKMSNEKLKRRAVRILRTVIPTLSDEDAKSLLQVADGKVKLAIAMHLIKQHTQLNHCDQKMVFAEDDKKQAEKVLIDCRGRLAEVIKKFSCF